MPSPFPGMNPYIEQAAVWQDFHTRFLTAAAELIGDQIEPRYFVKIEEHIYLHEPFGTDREPLGRPDLSVLPGPEAGERPRGAAVAAPATVFAPEGAEEVAQRFLEVRDRQTREVVSVVELLSPANKSTRDGRAQYWNKARRLLSRTSAGLVEIDLLRGGPRLPWVGMPRCDYYALVSRPAERPRAALWPVAIRESLPVVPVPLRPDEPEPLLDLQSLVHRIYDAARYRLFVYDTDPEPPLSANDAVWADQILHPARRPGLIPQPGAGCDPHQGCGSPHGGSSTSQRFLMPDETFTLRSPVPASADELYAWHARPLAFQRLQPPWEEARVVGQEGAFGADGFRVTVRTRVVGPVGGTWLAEGYDFRPGLGFRDRQLKGPFASWNHTHDFIPNGPDHSFLEDRIAYRVPLGAPGRVLGGGMVRRRLAAMFAYRHFVTASDLTRHATFAARPRLTVAVTGSRGLIGSDLVPFLTTGGHRVVRLLTGDATPPYDDGTKWVGWKPDAPPEPSALDGVDAVVHLAGDNVAEGRWSAAKKRKILESRTGPTRALAQSLAALPAGRRPKVFVCASAVGFYGNRGEEELTEDSPPGTGFFPDVVRAWEAACAPARDAGIRTVNVRIGVVLSPKAGALGKQLFAFKAGAGAVLGGGTQFTPWITVNDVVGAIYHALMSEELHGPVNAVGPNPVTNRAFTKALGRVLGRPAFLWLPRVALRALFGEVADEALLASMKARPAKLAMTGFAFDHTELEPALRFLLGR